MTSETEQRFIIDRRQLEFNTCPKFERHELSEDQVIDIAKKAVELARQEFYADVGKSITSKFFWIIGIVSMSVAGWLTSHGYLK